MSTQSPAGKLDAPVRSPTRTRKRLSVALVYALVVVSTLAGCAHAFAQPHAGYNLGRAADPAEIARQDIDVAPDGSGLPAGRGDAVDGAVIFAASCQRCHGTAIRLDPKRWPYATTLFDYVRRAMPPDRARPLSASEVYAIIAYELNVNGFVAPHELVDKMSLPRVKMPAAADFIQQP